MVRGVANIAGTKEGLAIALSLLVFGTFIRPNSARAQNPTMTLLNAGIDFGSNITGTTTMAYSSSSSAEFEIQFTNYNSATASVSFILPTNLQDAGGDNLPVSFSTNSAAYNVGTNSTSGATSFNPNTGILNATVNSGAHTDYFWLGGTITPGSNYVAADYSGTITASITVTVGSTHYSASLDIPTTASLQGNVSLSATGSLDFGQILAGTTPPSFNAQTNPNAPIFTVAGSRNSRLTVTYSSTSSLSDGFGHTLTLTPSPFGNSAMNQAGSTSVPSGSRVRTGNTGNYYLWLGGALGAIPLGQAVGNYDGAFVLEVAY